MARRPQVMRSQTIAVVEASTRRGDGGKPNQAGATFDYPCASPELHCASHNEQYAEPQPSIRGHMHTRTGSSRRGQPVCARRLGSPLDSSKPHVHPQIG